MSDLARSLVPYLSRLQLDRIRSTLGEREQPTAQELDGAVLFLDAVGFTALTEELSHHGPRGAELLSEVLASYFGAVLETIDEHGGDVLFFAGDALFALWAARRGDPDELNAAAIRAARCALAIQQRVPEIEPPHGNSLSFRASLGAGSLRALEVGGVDGRWMQLVRGEPLHDVRAADRQASPGDVVISGEFLRRLDGTRAKFDRLGSDLFRLRSMTVPGQPRGMAGLELPEELDGVLRRYVPRIVADRIAAGQSEYLAEFRQVTVLFVGLLGSDTRPQDGGVTDLATLHRAVKWVQEEVDRFEGVVDQLLEDDKGTSVVVAFGLPGSSHADDPVRAVVAAKAIHERLAQLGLRPTAGVATGLVFCGVHGGGHRRHYSLLGSTINLAARLVQIASQSGILCDEASRNAASDRVEFRAGGTTTPKGFKSPIPVYIPEQRAAHAATPVAAPTIIGRSSEADALKARLQSLLDGSPGGLVVIEAEAGMGKSTIITMFGSEVEGHAVHYASTAADSLESDTAYYAFRNVVRRWFDITPATSLAEARARVVRHLQSSTEFGPLVPLLNGVLGLDFPETDLTRQLRGQVRAENLQRLLLHVARERASEHPLVLCVEDGHWMDSASWSLLVELIRSIPRLLVVLSSRPTSDPAVEYLELKRRPGTVILELTPLTKAQTLELIRSLLGVSEVSAEVADLVSERAEGNPLYINELVRSLREAGAIRVIDGRCEQVDSEAVAPRLPATLEGIITARVDRLEPRAQLTVKVASVIGRHFEDDILLGVHPSRPSREELDAQLQALRASELIIAEPRAGSSGHSFSHALIHETTYGLLPYAQRQKFHHSVAEALESTHSGNLGPVQARLAHHFRLAQLPDRAVPYLAGAGEQALDAYASREAVTLLSDALALDQQVRGDLRIDIDRARWSRHVAQAWYNQNIYDQAAEWYETAVRRTGTHLRFGVGGAVVALGPLMLGPSPAGHSTAVPPRDAGRRERMIEGMRAMKELAAVYLWQADRVKFALNAINMAGLARKVGSSSESPYAIGIFAFLLSLVGLRRRAEKEGERSVAMAEEVGDLLQITSSNIARGMILTGHGKPGAALASLERAADAADALRAGLYKHRSKFMLAEALLWVGDYDRARQLFEQAAALSVGAEPHVAGFSNSMVALTLLRQGQVDEALKRLEAPDGVPMIREGGVGLSLVSGLGVLAEARLAAGDRAGALEAVEEAEAALTNAGDASSYFAGILGHAAIARVRLELGDHGTSRRGWFKSRSQLDLAFQHIRKITRMYPGGRARLCFLSGLRQIKLGRYKKARKLLRKAIAAAEAASTPYELGSSCMALASITQGPEKDDLIRQAMGVFESSGMKLQHDRAMRALGSD